MIAVKICGTERRGIDRDWIIQQIERRRRRGEHVYVMVRIETCDLSVRLATPGGPRRGPSRCPEPHEQAVLDLWIECGLLGSDIDAGSLLRFLDRVCQQQRYVLN